MPSRSGVTSNFGDFSRDITAMSERFQTEVKSLVEHTLGEIELGALRDAPAGGDPINTTHGPESQEKIRAGQKGNPSWKPINDSIGYVIHTGSYSGEVFVEKEAGDLVPWIEFSTGPDAARYLATVPPEWRALAATFIRNRKGSILGTPFFLPNVLKQEIKYKKEMKELIRRQRP